MNNEQTTQNDAEVLQYQDASDNRAQALRLLADIGARDTHNELSKIIWKDKQPTLVTTTRPNFATEGMDLGDGGPATDATERVPSSWEAKRDRQLRRGYTLEETPVMQFKGSSNLPSEYYQDNEEIEAYIATLKDNTY